MEHPSLTLWREHSPPGGYPAGVLPVPEPIPGTSFFPGGFGLWNPHNQWPLPRFPFGGVMVLGHDFHSETGYKASMERGYESPNQPTWRSMMALFADAGINPAECFFTNVYMGLRAGVLTTGPFPGRNDAAFVAHCSQFLVRQIEIQRPRLILTLGVVSPRILAPLAPQLDGWAAGRGLRWLDNQGPVQVGVQFGGVLGFSCTVAALVHPCLRHAAVRHRRYGPLNGAAAELSLLTDAISAAAIQVREAASSEPLPAISA